MSDTVENDAGEYAALWAVLRTADDPAEALGELLFDVWNEGWEAARSETGLFCSRAGGCLPPGMNERERYNQNPHPSTRPIPPGEGPES